MTIFELADGYQGNQGVFFQIGKAMTDFKNFQGRNLMLKNRNKMCRSLY